MCLHVILPSLEPSSIPSPTRCPNPQCSGADFRLHQVVFKSIRDGGLEHVPVHRYECRACATTFRVYPRGISQAHTSDRVKSLAALLYLSGLSYGAVAGLLDALGSYLCKSQVHAAVRAFSLRVGEQAQFRIFQARRTPSVGKGQATINWQGTLLTLALTADQRNGLVLTVNGLEYDQALVLYEQVIPLSDAIGASLTIS